MPSLERSGAARNGLPGFRPYVYKGGDVEPPAAIAPPLTAPARCRRCKYLTTSAGHRVTCDE